MNEDLQVQVLGAVQLPPLRHGLVQLGRAHVEPYLFEVKRESFNAEGRLTENQRRLTNPRYMSKYFVLRNFHSYMMDYIQLQRKAIIFVRKSEDDKQIS